MKRPLLWGVALFLVAAGSITVFKLRGPEDSRPLDANQAAHQSRVTLFWETYNRAGVLRTQGQYGSAATAYRRALSINPEHEDSLYYLATCLYEMGDYEAAQAELRKLIRLDPESGRAYGQLGRLLSSRAPGAPTDLAAARQAFQRQLAIYREQAGPLLDLGRLELNQGNLPAAESSFRTAIALGSPEAKFLTGYVLFLQKRPVEAREFFHSVLEAYWADRRAAARGVLSEGDVLPAPGKPLTPLQRSALRSALFSYWADVESGTAPQQALEALHLREAALPPLFLAREGSGSAARGSALVAEQAMTGEAGSGGTRSTFHTCIADFDGDGRPDRLEVGTATKEGSSVRLFRNTGTRFVNVTDAAGLKTNATAMDCAVADFDGDSRPDLFVMFWRREAILYRNQGGRFEDVTSAAGLRGVRGGSFSSVAFDYDRDGHPDLLVTYPAPLEEVARSVLEPGQPAGGATPRLFRNLGNGTFQETTAALGLRHAYGTIQAVVADFDADGWLDLLLISGSPEADFLAPSVLLHNLAGQGFEERLLAPGGTVAGNFLGGAVLCPAPPESCRLYLVSHPVLRRQQPGGLFRISQMSFSSKRSAADRPAASEPEVRWVWARAGD